MEYFHVTAFQIDSHDSNRGRHSFRVIQICYSFHLISSHFARISDKMFNIPNGNCLTITILTAEN